MTQSPTASPLFTPIMIGAVEIPNRFVRSATAEFMADADGFVTDRLVGLFHDLAEGEVGLIITGHAYVRPDGQAGPFQTAVSDDRFLPGLKRITATVHAFPSRIFLQLAHAGRQTKVKLVGGEPIAPSAVFEPTFKLTPREVTPNEIEHVKTDFIQAARRAREAGFDGVQVHCAHGYLPIPTGGRTNGAAPRPKELASSLRSFPV
jgi:2,4-dienoyl-CoA reductase-like NADH-dependent reductase (Old Yellow Enzyme family)